MNTPATVVDDRNGPIVVLGDEQRRQIQALAATAPVWPILGFLAGRHSKATVEGGYKVIVTHALEGNYLLHSYGRPLWTAATLRDAKERAKQPATCKSCCLVGWLFSQPGWGVYVTDDDLAFHRGYFRAAWKIFIGVDPIRRKAEIFGWSADCERIVKLEHDWKW